MSSFTNTVFTSLLAWVRALAASLWAALSGEENSLLVWLGENWIPLVAGICVFGVLADLAVYMARWQPYRVWASFIRRLRGRRAEAAETGEAFHWEEAPKEADALAEEAPARNRRAARYAEKRPASRLKALLRPEGEVESSLRFRRITPARNKEEAYSEPYIPPQWRDPTEGSALPRRRMRRSNHD